MIDWEEQQCWTVGDIVHKMREEEKLGLEQLSKGLCSVATLSRIESGEREMDLLLACRIFQRLGYKLNKYELYATEEELQQWEQRRQMEKLADRKETESLAYAIREYRDKWGANVEKNPLQRQFLGYIQGLLKMQEGCFQEAKKCLESAALQIAPDWEAEIKEAALGEMELRILKCLGDVYECLNHKEKSEDIWEKLFENIGREKKRIKTYLKLYTEIFCKYANKMIKTMGVKRTLKRVEICLEIMREEKKSCYWPELLHIQSKCLESLFREDGKEKETMLKSWQKTYYIYRLYNKQEEAEKVKEYLEGAYHWDCII